jgi:hypothetical protein
MTEQSTENIPIGTLRAEAGSVELVHSESMSPTWRCSRPSWEDKTPAEPINCILDGLRVSFRQDADL